MKIRYRIELHGACFHVGRVPLRIHDYMEPRMSRHDQEPNESEMNPIIPFPTQWPASNVARPDGTIEAPAALSGYNVHTLNEAGMRPRTLFTNWEARSTSPCAAHVLIMDDNPEILDILGQLLGDEAYAVTLSPSPLSPGEIQQLEPDVIMLDAIFNRSTTGLELITTLRADVHTRDIPLICSTVLPHIAQDLFDAGYTTLLKPFELDDVLEAMTVAVDLQHRA